MKAMKMEEARALGLLEIGAASLHVELNTGLITVSGPNGNPLLNGPIDTGGWSLIIAAILAAAPQATGPMRDGAA